MENAVAQFYLQFNDAYGLSPFAQGLSYRSSGYSLVGAPFGFSVSLIFCCVLGFIWGFAR